MAADLDQRGDAWEGDDLWYNGGQGRPLRVQTREGFRRNPPLPLLRPYRQPQPALDKNTNTVSQSGREQRYALRDGLREITTIPRVAKCGHVHIGRLPSVHLVKDESGTARYQGVLTCGNIWTCPECSARLGGKRAQRLTNYLTAWMARDGQVLFLTLTMPHDFADALEVSCSTMQRAFTRILSGRRWQELKTRYGITGLVRALEVTLGINGWHPHMHVLLFLDRRLDRLERDALQAILFQTHSAAVTKAGFRAPDIRNCPLKAVASENIGEYIAKISAARELTSSHTKQARQGGRTPFQLLADAVKNNDPKDRARWHEWEHVMPGRRQLTWSRGMEATLKTLASDLLEDERRRRHVTTVAIISRPLWERIRRRPGLPARLLDIVEGFGYEAALELLRRTAGKDFSDLPWAHFTRAGPIPAGQPV